MLAAVGSVRVIIARRALSLSPSLSLSLSHTHTHTHSYKRTLLLVGGLLTATDRHMTRRFGVVDKKAAAADQEREFFADRLKAKFQQTSTFTSTAVPEVRVTTSTISPPTARADRVGSAREGVGHWIQGALFSFSTFAHRSPPPLPPNHPFLCR